MDRGWLYLCERRIWSFRHIKLLERGIYVSRPYPFDMTLTDWIGWSKVAIIKKSSHQWMQIRWWPDHWGSGQLACDLAASIASSTTQWLSRPEVGCLVRSNILRSGLSLGLTSISVWTERHLTSSSLVLYQIRSEVIELYRRNVLVTLSTAQNIPFCISVLVSSSTFIGRKLCSEVSPSNVKTLRSMVNAIYLKAGKEAGSGDQASSLWIPKVFQIAPIAWTERRVGDDCVWS